MVFAQNTMYGDNALINNTTGWANTAMGDQTLLFNTTGIGNTATGSWTLRYNTTGNKNTATGFLVLHFNRTDTSNTAIGYATMHHTTGSSNTAAGDQTLLSNTMGNSNTGTGYYVLRSNTTGNYNTSIGGSALDSNTTGFKNTATGRYALHSNTTGAYNTTAGHNSLYSNTTGSNNVGIGHVALGGNTTGSYNTALGAYANSGPNYNYSMALGYNAKATASNQARIGHTGITSIGGHQNWTNLSDGRFKNNIQENVKGLEFINALRPVSYSIDHKTLNDFLGVKLEGDEASKVALSGTSYQTGFIAQEVEATAKKLGFDQFHGVDAPKNETDHYGLRYAEFVVPLVKSVQELSTQNEEEQTTIDELKAMLAQQQTQIEQLLQANTLSTTTTKVLKGARLGQNNPNPFSVETQIQVEVPAKAQSAFLQVSNLEGKQLFIQAINERGTSSVTLAAGQLPAGIYLYTLVVDNQLVDSKRMVLTK